MPTRSIEKVNTSRHRGFYNALQCGTPELMGGIPAFMHETYMQLSK